MSAHLVPNKRLPPSIHTVPRLQIAVYTLRARSSEDEPPALPAAIAQHEDTRAYFQHTYAHTHTHKHTHTCMHTHACTHSHTCKHASYKAPSSYKALNHQRMSSKSLADAIQTRALVCLILLLHLVQGFPYASIAPCRIVVTDAESPIARANWRLSRGTSSFKIRFM